MTALWIHYCCLYYMYMYNAGLEDIGKDVIQEESYFILLQPKLYEQNVD